MCNHGDHDLVAFRSRAALLDQAFDRNAGIPHRGSDLGQHARAVCNDEAQVSLAGAMADAKTREASLITFLASAANITMLGVGGVFWGLVIGLIAYGALNGRWSLRSQKEAANMVK